MNLACAVGRWSLWWRHGHAGDAWDQTRVPRGLPADRDDRADERV